MIRFMEDSDKLTALTGHSELLATYADLIHDRQTFEAQFPHSAVIYIDRGLGDPGNIASVFDVEAKAHIPGQAPGWFDRKHASGVEYLTIYCNRSNIAAVNKAMERRNFYRWVATLDGTTALTGFDPLHAPAAVQCLSSKMLGVHADGSLVLEDSWHPTRLPVDVWVLRRELHIALTESALTNMSLNRLAALLGG